MTRRVEAGVNGLARFIANHWLLLANVAIFAFILPTLLAPYLASVSAYWPSRMIYLFYRLTCHQRPERSLFLFGHKMPICARCMAIYMSFWGLGLLYSVWKATPWGRRHRPKSLPIKWLAVLAVPMFIDGVAQLVGLYKSTNLLRTITGTLVGAGIGLFIYPILDEGFAQAQRAMLCPGSVDTGSRCGYGEEGTINS
ncbi:MAG: DUF2085 domain-containing protein [Anaerolineae bacterium]